MLGQLTEVMSMDDVQVLYPKERITLYGINSNCELFLPIARSSFPSYFPFCFCSLLLQRRAVAALLSPGEVHGVVLCIALVFLSFLRFLLYSVDWTSVGHSLRCGSLGLETSTLNSIDFFTATANRKLLSAECWVLSFPLLLGLLSCRWSLALVGARWSCLSGAR